MRTLDLFRRGLRDEARERGWPRALAALLARLAGVVRESFPDRRRMRYGDIHYDFEHNVNTTWANVSFATRLREALVGADYQTTDPIIFTEVMEMLGEILAAGPSGSECQSSSDATRSNGGKTWGTQFRRFTFVDLGSGKGRVLLMAAEYPFARIIGVELLPELDAIARENIARVVKQSGNGSANGEPRIELLISDARDFVFPADPLVVFLFNPFPAWVLREVLRNVNRALELSRQPVFLILHNPVHESEIASVAPGLKRLGGNPQFVLYGHA